MAALTLETAADPLPSEPGSDWERFYANYRKPGYVPGYEVVHKLGGGVFGIVFKARKESIGKNYAIKFLKIDDPGVKEQVLRELETVSLFAQVDHPNLVSIEDKGVVDGIPYIVMGYAGEETLRDRLDEGPLPTEEAYRVFVQVLRGVQALHDHSLIHFDLKPANVFLRGDVARVGDYGLSKLVTGSRMSLSFGRGTPYYMAPEMLHRKGDHRSDIYSLGAMFYECLCGRVPFDGENEWEVLEGHRARPLELPAALPPAFRAVLGRMLAKEPEERYQSVAEVLRDLRAPVALGESVVLEYAPGAAPAATARPTRAPAVPPVVRPPVGPENLASSLIRAMVIALLLPARVLGLGFGRGLAILFTVPFAILGFLGRLSLFFLGAIAVLLLIVIVFSLVAGA
ncbi:MAG: serine/threonine-protein kinase [Planctomycetota bacterium]